MTREKMVLKGKVGSEGIAEGKALVTKQSISFWGGVNPMTGIVTELRHELKGQSITGKILVIPSSKGSSANMITIHRMGIQFKTAPKAIISARGDPLCVGGTILAKIPMIFNLDRNPLEIIDTGDLVKVDCYKGEVEVQKI